MKKDRNSFFSQYGVSAYNTQPFMYPNMNNMNNMAAMNNSNMQNYPYDTTNEIDARISKLEREIQRLDARLSKLESTLVTPTTQNTDYNFANSMYMV